MIDKFGSKLYLLRHLGHQITGSAKMVPLYDLFLSYKSEDIAWVERLKQSLEVRGVKVWLDKDQIRPGDLFAEALEKGIVSSKCVGLVITGGSLKSNWVREEYYRAVSLVSEKKLHLIPILLQKVPLPGFLQGRQYVDLSDDRVYEKNVDRLIWPGITGRKIEIVWVRSSRIVCHNTSQVDEHSILHQLVRELGAETITVRLDSGLNSWWNGAKRRHLFRGPRHVVFINLFDDDLPLDNRLIEPKPYVDFIFSSRKLTAGTDDELVFVLYHKSGSFKNCQNIEPQALERFSHYFAIEHSQSKKKLSEQLGRLWINVQNLLMSTELYIPHVDELCLTALFVYAIYNKHIRKMKISFSANFFVQEEEVEILYDYPNIVVHTPGKTIVGINADRYFDIEASESGFILKPKNYNGVSLDYKANIQVKPSFHSGFSYSYIDLRIEFQKIPKSCS